MRILPTVVTLLLGLALLWSAVPAGTAFSDDDPDALPSLKDAISKELHGRLRIRKNQVDILYDFKKQEQGEDFGEVAGVIKFGGGMSVTVGGVSDKPVQLEGKTLPLKGNTPIRLKAPLEMVQKVVFGVGGVEAFHVQLRGPGKSLNFWIGESTGAGIGDDGFRNLFLSQKSLNLQPEKTYRVEVGFTRKAAVAKLDGRKILEAKLPTDFVMPNEVRFSSDSEKRGYLGSLHVKGTVSDTIVEVAANRGRGAERKAPLFVADNRLEGDHFIVQSQRSEKHAVRWLEKLESLASAIFEDFPPAAKDVDPPRREVYIFHSKVVFEGYCGKHKNGRLPTGAVAILEETEDETEEDDSIIELEIFNLMGGAEEGLESVVGGLLRQVHSGAPDWWRSGCTLFYTGIAEDEKSFQYGVARPELAAKARAYIDNRETPKLSDMLGGSSAKSSKSRSVVWAWVHFLMRAEDRKYRGHMKKFHEALIAGKSAGEASEEAFSTKTFNDLYSSFMAHLQAM